MATGSILGAVGNELIKILAALVGDKLKEWLKKRTSQQLLLDLNHEFYQLDLQSELFVSRLGQLVGYAKELGKHKRNVRAASPRDELIEQVRESIHDIGWSLKRIASIAKQFAPTLDVYDSALLDRLLTATQLRTAVVEQAGRILTEMAGDPGMTFVLNAPSRISPASLKELQESYLNAQSALDLIHQARQGLKDFILKTYPILKEVPE